MDNCKTEPVMSSEIHGGHENISRRDQNEESINTSEGFLVSKQSQNSSKYSLSEGVDYTSFRDQLQKTNNDLCNETNHIFYS